MSYSLLPWSWTQATNCLLPVPLVCVFFLYVLTWMRSFFGHGSHSDWTVLKWLSVQHVCIFWISKRRQLTPNVMILLHFFNKRLLYLCFLCSSRDLIFIILDYQHNVMHNAYPRVSCGFLKYGLSNRFPMKDNFPNVILSHSTSASFDAIYKCNLSFSHVSNNFSLISNATVFFSFDPVSVTIDVRYMFLCITVWKRHREMNEEDHHVMKALRTLSSFSRYSTLWLLWLHYNKIMMSNSTKSQQFSVDQNVVFKITL